MRSLRESGDTIVEVLLAITIVSLMLAGAYVTARSSLKGSRQSQERGEAIKLAEMQLEYIKGFAKTPSVDIFNPATPSMFCFNTSSQRVNMPIGTLPALDVDNFATAPAGNYPAECLRGPDGRYHLAIERSGDTFTSAVRWDRIGGGAREEVKFVYRLYESN